jgi:hypothetical protein
MEPLNGYSGFIGMFAAAIISGAIGGLIFELMPGNADTHIGLLKIPGGSTGGKTIDLGFLSNVLLGAVAAVAILYFFPPETQTITVEKGISQTSYSYDLIKLVALSLIVGSAGPSFLSSIQGRLAGALNAQRAADANVAANKIDTLAQSMQASLQKQHDDAKVQVANTVKEMVNSEPVVVAANGNHDSPAVLGIGEMVGERQKVVDATVNKLHAICDNTVADLRVQLQEQADTTKKEMRQQMSSN